MRVSVPESTKGRKSTWRGAVPLPVKVGTVERARVGCAM
jgi:hypothetical protein